MSVTLRRDLRTGIPVWQAGRPPRFPAFGGLHDNKFDVIIVGTGISGALAADALLAAGLSVMVLDRVAAPFPVLAATASRSACLRPCWSCGKSCDWKTPMRRCLRLIKGKSALEAFALTFLAA
jgi:glycine/D-amino acid oxidase-like deaminating enzyme